MQLFLSGLFACASVSLPPPDPLAVEERWAFAPTASGGFDDGSGHAVGWAVDEDDHVALVVAMRYAPGAAQVSLAPDADAAATADGYVPAVPAALEHAVARFAVLGLLVTDVPGIAAMPGAVTAVVYRGREQARVLDSVWVAADGDLALDRPDAPPDVLDGSLVFVQADGLGADATVLDPSFGVSVDGFSFDFPGAG